MKYIICNTNWPQGHGLHGYEWDYICMELSKMECSCVSNVEPSGAVTKWQIIPNHNSYTRCPRRKGQNFRRVFLMLKYTDIIQNTYMQSWTVTEIMAREKCGLLAGLRTVPCQLTAFRLAVLDCRVRLQKYRWRSYVSTPLWLTMHVMYSAWNP